MAYRRSALSEIILAKSAMAFSGCTDVVEHHPIVDLSLDITTTAYFIVRTNNSINFFI